MLDLITDFTVGYEDYHGFSKKLGIFEMFLVIFTLIHENIRSSISLYATEKELLMVKLGKHNIEIADWRESELYKSDDTRIQFFIMMFWPFAIRKRDGCLQRFKAAVYNILTAVQLRPVVDRLRVLMHSPTNLRVIYRQRAEQDSLKQFYLITEQLPELLVQFYTLQILFNIAGDKDISSNCESGHNFSYPRFTDSLNSPNETNWFCSQFPISSDSGLMTCDISFRLFSAMIPFFMIPSGIVSLEVDFRLLDAATPKMKNVVQYLLQAAYTLMIPARLLMFAALMHAITIKEIISGRWQAPAAVSPEGPKDQGESHSRARRAREWLKPASPRARRARGRAKPSACFGACQCYYMFFTIQPKIAIFVAQFKYLNDGQYD